MRPPVYLDHAASTPVDPLVAAAMAECLAGQAGTANPAATHAAGRAAAARVEAARAEVAALIGARPAEIIWTSGATESDNLAVIGGARVRAARGGHLVTSVIEHPAVTESCRWLETRGFRVTWLRPDRDGLVAPAAVAAALRPDTVLVSLAAVNHEIGVIQDVAAIGALCRERDLLFHVDAAQALGRVPIDVRRDAIDLLSVSGHKIGGPKGTGALFIDADRPRRVEPLFHGGGQERGLRPGTVATHQVVGLGRACALAGMRREADVARVGALRARLEARLLALEGVLLNGHPARRACHIVNVSVAGVDGESLRLALRDLAIASGSACTSADPEPSAVLRALGRDEVLAGASLRISMGRTTTPAEVDFAAERIVAAIDRLRALAPPARVAPA